MIILPPGTLLQLMYLRERIFHFTSGSFIEIGPGSGEITQLLLDCGWIGSSYDIDPKTIASLSKRFAKEIDERRYLPINQNYIECKPTPKKVDLVISSMVLEHLDDNAEISFMHKSKKCLKHKGLMIALVPASPRHWGIEDEIAGHYRRYTRQKLEQLTTNSSWDLLHIAGLTLPTSNFLLPISNFLVKRSELTKLELSFLERTKHSGRREVKFKTYLPTLFGLIVNKYTLNPLYKLQNFFSKSECALVLYFEATPHL